MTTGLRVLVNMFKRLQTSHLGKPVRPIARNPLSNVSTLCMQGAKVLAILRICAVSFEA